MGYWRTKGTERVLGKLFYQHWCPRLCDRFCRHQESQGSRRIVGKTSCGNLSVMKEKELSGVPLLIFANKQDLVQALQPDEVDHT